MNKIKLDKLFSEFKIRNLTLRNRIVFLAHWTALSTIEGRSSEEETYYYAERAKGGAGLIISGNYTVSESGQVHRACVNASDDKAIPNLKNLVKAVHKYDAKIFAQITHFGPTKLEKPGPNLYAPSQVIERSTNSYTIELDKNGIKEIIGSFSRSAQNLAESGFDGVELKVGHDGLLRTFFSPYYNKRTDEYGGDFKKNMSMLVEVISSVRKNLRDDMALGVRLCLDEFDDFGYNLESGIKFAKYLTETGLLDYLNTDAGSWNTCLLDHSPMSLPLGFTEYLYAAVKKEVNVPVIAFGRINDPVQAEQILQRGSADLIGMVRQLICDPLTPKKSVKGSIDDIKKCIACNEGCSAQVMTCQPVRCIQNPAVGREKIFGIGTLRKAGLAKKIVVVGGGAAGLKFSEIAAKRGHNVVLFEKEKILGGQINLLKKIPFRNEFSEVIRYLEFQVKQLDSIALNISAEADEESILGQKPDVVVIASGAEPFIPKHFCGAKTITGWQLLDDSAGIGKNVIIYDRFSKNEGMGVAEYLFEIYENIKVQYFTPTKHRF
jgi:2,4-dienoyl-CoA reductase-like NADH-dependent reductase (Old Yellow Enzyme family)